MVDALAALDRACDGRSRSRYPIGSGDPAVLRTERARHAARHAQGWLAGPIDILPPASHRKRRSRASKVKIRHKGLVLDSHRIRPAGRALARVRGLTEGAPSRRD